MVSVIIPTYNYGHYIAETLASVIAQSYADFECIIVDNGSTDNTKEIVKPFLQDKRFIYIYQENKGVSHGRNTGMKAAKGEYIQFLDADDLIEKDKLRSAVKFLVSHLEYDLVYSDMRYFKDGEINKLFMSYSCDESRDNAWMSYVSGSGEKVANVFLNGNTMVISSPVFRRSILSSVGYFDESIQHNEDWDFWMRIVLSGKSIKFLNDENSKTLIRIHKKSASRNIFKMQVCGLAVLEKNREAIKSLGLSGKWQQRVNDHVYGITESLLKVSSNNEFREKINYLRQFNLYDKIFNREVGDGLKAKLFLRFKKLFS